ncbi:MAG: hypothetical protein DCC52_03860 [Chloroflexi bacterium]|nr:MAG: hypothetical protein DCC52_03860 [Chloroflexota bacterium]
MFHQKAQGVPGGGFALKNFRAREMQREIGAESAKADMMEKRAVHKRVAFQFVNGCDDARIIRRDELQRIRRDEIGNHRAVGAARGRGGQPARVIFLRGAFQRGVQILGERVIRKL